MSWIIQTSLSLRLLIYIYIFKHRKKTLHKVHIQKSFLIYKYMQGNAKQTAHDFLYLAIFFSGTKISVFIVFPPKIKSHWQWVWKKIYVHIWKWNQSVVWLKCPNLPYSFKLLRKEKWNYQYLLSGETYYESFPETVCILEGLRLKRISSTAKLIHRCLVFTISLPTLNCQWSIPGSCVFFFRRIPI